jgi:hypothetical protein
MSSDAPYSRPPTPLGQYVVQPETYGLEARFWTTSGLPTTRPNGTHLTQAAPARRTKNFTCEIVLSSEFRKR